MSIKMLIASAKERRQQRSETDRENRMAKRKARREARVHHKAAGTDRTARRPITRERMKRVADAIRQEFRAPRTFKEEVEAALIPLLPDNKATAADVADQLGISRQTLYRRLREEETSFTDVLDAKRRQLAIYYLQAERASMKVTAWKLGFASSEAFSRAFKRWTGSSPGKFRSKETSAD